MHKEFQTQDKQLATTLGQIRQIRLQIDQIKKIRNNSDGTNLGYERINNLTGKLKEEEIKTKELSLDIKSMQRINTEQYSELERIEDTKGYSAKID